MHHLCEGGTAPESTSRNHISSSHQIILKNNLLEKRELGLCSHSQHLGLLLPSWGGTRLTCHFKVITWNISFEFVQQARGNWMLIFFHRNLELAYSFAILYGVWSSGKGRTQACLQPLFTLLTISKVCLVMKEPFSAPSVIVLYIKTYSLYISSKSDDDLYQLMTDGTCRTCSGRSAPGQRKDAFTLNSHWGNSWIN